MQLSQVRNELATRGVGSLITKSKSNAKLAKGDQTWHVFGFSGAPANTAGVGNQCTGSTQRCRDLCLHQWGRAEFFRRIHSAQVARTKFMVKEPELFDLCLRAEVERECRYASRRKMPTAFRPDVFTDLHWHRLCPWLFDLIDQVYGYTKVKSKMRAYLEGSLPSNYHLTWSWRGDPATDVDNALWVLSNGGTVTVPFLGGIPSTFLGYPTIDGDKDDKRFLDPPSTVIGLSPKLPKSKQKRIEMLARAGSFFQKGKL